MVVRLTILFNKNPKLSVDEFNAYWSEHHASLFASLPIVKERLVKYSQFHLNRDGMGAIQAALPVAQFDGAAEFWAHSLEDILAVFTDPEYIRVIIPDEKNFVDRESARALFGYDEIKVSESHA